ncbi:MTREC (exosome adaptor) complex proline-rich subunit Iss10/Pir1 [Schizosaccharomyces osmophilus]|uniref:MTREC (Exosome adaptor) complex proline-rich subunit Iss10/Pir1 n=1 Tax=Schizosaccharomyces osmophilus TaxID=2545709 RepID=A0AAE9WDW6_9SCHI|nr:MTREC (exosome adaptor) complex proline-rich subunit Iss10/Pir1 [Schizosaccharomyces osmophilus]WBW74415.1 MTREC (exosome adaptor) complex proline-rich subunit Iss10/Pir1 [Schizosaccharomyces osmophilus]
MNPVEWEQEFEKIIVFRNTVFKGEHSRIEVPEEAKLNFLKEKLSSSLKRGSKKREHPQNRGLQEETSLEVKDSEPKVHESSGSKRSISETPLIEELKPVSSELTNIPGLGLSRVQRSEGSLEALRREHVDSNQEKNQKDNNNVAKEHVEGAPLSPSGLPVVSDVSYKNATLEDAGKPEKTEDQKDSSQLQLFVSKSLEQIDMKSVKQASSFKDSQTASDIPSPPMSAFAPSRVSAPSPPRVPTFSVPSLKHIQSPVNELSSANADKLPTHIRFPSPPPSAAIQQPPKKVYSSSLKDEVANVTVKDEELSPRPPPPETLFSSSQPSNQQQAYSPTWAPYEVNHPQTTIRRVPDLPPTELYSVPADAGSSRPTYSSEITETKVRFHPYERNMTGMHSRYPSSAESISVPPRNSVAPLQFASYNREGSYVPQHYHPTEYSLKDMHNLPAASHYGDFESYNDQYNSSSSYSPYYHHRVRSTNAFPQMQVPPSASGYYNPSAAVNYRSMTPNPAFHSYPLNDPRNIDYHPNGSYNY